MHNGVYLYTERRIEDVKRMKIALQVGIPEQEQLTAFMQSFADSSSLLAESLIGGTDEVIAAYDCGRLVGVGSRIETPDHLPALQVYIAPGYECRGIGDHMRKLMLPTSNRLVTAG
jgi:hypothetical protein